MKQWGGPNTSRLLGFDCASSLPTVTVVTAGSILNVAVLLIIIFRNSLALLLRAFY
jgi:hypothetical protein